MAEASPTEPMHVYVVYPSGKSMLSSRAMAKKLASGTKDGGAWIFRNIPRDLMKRAKIAAAREGTSIKGLVLETLEARIEEIEKKHHGK